MVTSLNSKLVALEAFLTDHPNITLITSTSPNYSSIRKTYLLNFQDVPFAIVRPQTSNDVAALVLYATENSIQIVIRSGGNNLFGLSVVQDALVIDMRDIAYVKVDEARATAKVGGGIINGDLAAELSKEGLMTAIGSVPFVGYTGWSTYGGYGPFSANYGLGLDNIVEAKVVNWKGEVVDANERMLKGIRGAGGFIGVLVELTIKVYPLKKILAGALIIDSQDINNAFQTFNKGFNELSAKGLPKELYFQNLAVITPHGKAFAAGFVWGSDDHDKGRDYLAQIEGLGTVVMNTVQPVTVSEYTDSIASMVPSNAYGTLKTINIRKMTNEVISVIGRNLEKMPLSIGTSLSIHDLHGPSAAPNNDSVFRSREPHFLLELIAATAKQEDSQESLEWITNFYNDLIGTNAENILPGTYISLTSPKEVDLSKIYGPNYETILELKREYDPQNIFNHAIPRIAKQ